MKTFRYHLHGFRPDADPTEPHILVTAVNALPTITGMVAPRSWLSRAHTLAATCVGLTTAFRLDGTTYVVAGTGTALYEKSASAWTNVTRAAGGAYSAGTFTRWQFAQYGNISLAANIGDKIQARDASAAGVAFANLSDAPKATIVETALDFVLAFNTDDATSAGAAFGRSPDRWWCCAAGDHTNWTPSIATQSASDRLVDTPGEITAAKKLAEHIVVYKDTSFYLGSYVGPPLVWSYRLISNTVGCVGPEAVVEVNNVHYFMGNDDFYAFDGATLTPIGVGHVREALYRDSSIKAAYTERRRTVATYDTETQCILFFCPLSSSGVVGLAYSPIARRWGRILHTDSWVTGITPYISASAAPITALMSNTNVLWAADSSAANMTLMTGFFGVSGQSIIVNRVRPNFHTSLSASVLRAQLRRMRAPGHDEQIGPAVSATYAAGSFDFIAAGRWFQFTISNDLGGGNIVAIDSLDIEYERDSLE